ncbi:hypothetical protein [Streptomyces antarcticus]|uniref:hypothetical protein n=1 Tax=Streptomyces antarcticus TaxID=2996458 RepID=UPI00226E3E07|nr:MULTISPECIES: hypothetical protein [unclassified Streptomyces]MCY0944602.1 hypothetical protein [Streptomyces sp. H34-AA3]MCY0954511.1 hypothetical protein [Streptomyces sp. H27-S2]MCZ4087109.1 hypothetical protein [Streptomyces sp. H34-S5]
MLTYENVMNAPLAQLQAAVTDWKAMAGKLHEMAEGARNGLKAKADKAQWSGVTAGVAREFVTKTAKEFEDAAKEATGMHGVLADAHATFKAAQDQLKRLVAEAPAAGFQVDATGRVTALPLATEGERNAARHDPDYQQSLRTNRDAWQARINRAVEDAADADDSLCRVLRANAGDQHDFSGPAFTTLDAEQAARAADLMKKVTGEGGTARNVEALRELEDLLDDNREDPEFATGFYRTIGPEGTLEMYSKMSLDATGLGPIGRDRALMVANIQSDMGALLGLATHKDIPHHLDAAWTTGLMKAGRKEMDVTGGVTKIYGYQALGALLREGKYDTEFLTSVGRDMIAMDRKNPQAWEYTTPMSMDMALNQGEGGDRGFYPLTGLMEALVNNPDAATAFFNEPVREDSNHDGIVTKDDKAVGGKHGEDQGMVDYVLDKKPHMDSFDITRTGDLHPAQQAVGDALMAAVSHRGPGDEDSPPVAHTKEMASVMERVVEKVGDKPELVAAKPGEPDGPLKGLSGHFGQMAAEYAPDIQASADDASHMIKANGERAVFDKKTMADFISAVAQDPDAYGAITTSQRTYTTMLINDVFEHRNEYEQLDAAIKTVVHPGGQIAGILSEARAEGSFAENGHKAEEYVKGVEENAKWINRGISAAGGKYLELVPLAGDVLEWLQEDITESVVEGAKKDQAKENDEADDKAVIDYTNAQKQAGVSAAESVRKAAEGTGMNQRSIDALAGVASSETANGHAVGRGQIATSNGGK